MAVLLDTRLLDPADRAEAVAAAMRSARVPAVLTHEVPAADVHARVDLWALGGSLGLLHRTSSAVRLTRTPGQVGGTAADRVALTLLGPGEWSYHRRGSSRTVRSPRWELILVDHATPYEFVRRGSGSTFAFGIDTADLGLPAGTVAAAADRLERSPLHTLVRRHLLDLARSVDRLSGPAATMLGTATAELTRAYLLSAVGGRAAPATPESLLVRTRAWIDAHRADADLSPARIARAHAVSVRRLYAAWSGQPETLAGYVLGRRLDLAAELLTRPGARHRTIESIARGCGFADPAHFSRRFRQAYGCTPREWRTTHAG
jgi:AraC-like DNA-binding protein